MKGRSIYLIRKEILDKLDAKLTLNDDEIAIVEAAFRMVQRGRTPRFEPDFRYLDDKRDGLVTHLYYVAGAQESIRKGIIDVFAAPTRKNILRLDDFSCWSVYVYNLYAINLALLLRKLCADGKTRALKTVVSTLCDTKRCNIRCGIITWASILSRNGFVRALREVGFESEAQAIVVEHRRFEMMPLDNNVETDDDSMFGFGRS